MGKEKKKKLKRLNDKKGREWRMGAIESDDEDSDEDSDDD